MQCNSLKLQLISWHPYNRRLWRIKDAVELVDACFLYWMVLEQVSFPPATAHKSILVYFTAVVQNTTYSNDIA